MVIYNLSSIFDRATGERQIVFLTSKVSLVSLAKLDFRVEETFVHQGVRVRVKKVVTLRFCTCVSYATNFTQVGSREEPLNIH